MKKLFVMALALIGVTVGGLSLKAAADSQNCCSTGASCCPVSACCK